MDVAVLDAVPLYRLGAVAALGGGHGLASPSELATWLAPGRPVVVLVSLRDPEDERWKVVADLSDRDDVLVVAVLTDPSQVMTARALRAGAANVVPRDVDPETLRRTVEETMRGVVSVPLLALRSATSAPTAGHRVPPPNDEELLWLRQLRRGVTVATLAEQTRLSERVLYRRLRELYRKLGVAGRTEALILGRDEGWL